MIRKSKVFLHWWNSRKFEAGGWGLGRDSQKQNSQIIYPKTLLLQPNYSVFHDKDVLVWQAGKELHQTIIKKKKSPSWILNTINPGETALVFFRGKTFSWNPETSNPGTGTGEPGLMLASTRVSIGSTKAFLQFCLQKHLIKMRCESLR